MKLDFRQRLLATTLLVGAGLLATPAYAQDTPPADVAEPSGPVEGQEVPASSATGEPVQEGSDIVVTGSRIPQPNLESVAPVTVVTSQDIKLQGTTRVEDLLNSLPSVVASQTSGVSNASDGTASVDLRGLGSARTLVLVNGRRLVPGDPAPTSGSAADINIIPASLLLKRVEVLTGGASSTYGADAVAGVVNFIMDTNFTGIRFDGQYSVYQHSNRNKLIAPLLNARQAQGFDGYSYPTGSTVDGGAFDGTISLGAGFDDNRGHATVYLGYRKVNPVLQSRRDYSACTIQNVSAEVNQCGGSSFSGEGNVLLFDNSTSTFYTVAPNRVLNRGRTRYNFAPTNYFQRPDERYTAGLFANYEISPAIKPYVEFMFMDDRTVAQIAPSGNFANTTTINCDNPFISAQQRAIICDTENLVSGFVGNFPLTPVSGGAATPIDFIDPTTGATYNKAFFQIFRRNVEGGPRRSDLQHTTYRGVVGTRGDLDKVWSYDTYYSYGRVNYQQVYSNEQSTARLTRAVDVVTDPVSGLPVCRSFLDGSDPACRPYDFLGGTISPDALNYVAATGFQKGQTSEQVANISFTGLLGEYGVKTPWADDGFAVNFGFEYRKDSIELDTDQAFRTGDLTGQGAPTLPISGNFRVHEFFGEAQMPIVRDNFIHELTLSAGYRKSYYKTSADGKYDTDTYKVGVEFAPIRDIRFRAAYNRAVRAPNIQELFAQQYVGLDGTQDPCADLTITAANFGCIATGLAVGDRTPGNPSGQYNGLLGGNIDLQPEKATTKTLGFVFQPSFLPRFALTVDYFDIKVKNAIQGFGADAIISDCVDNATATFTPVSCSLVVRDAGGSIWLTSGGYVEDLPTNIGGVQTKGFEISSSYSHKIGNGTLSASMNATRLTKFITDNGISDIYDCAGFYGPICSGGGTTLSGGPLPKWRHKARVSYNMDNGVGLSLGWRRVGRVEAEVRSNDETLSGSLFFNPGQVIKAQNYFDFASSFTIGDHYNFRLGVNNLFDRTPPLVTSGDAGGNGSLCPTGPCNGNTYPGTYDALGRYFFAGVTLDF